MPRPNECPVTLASVSCSWFGISLPRSIIRRWHERSRRSKGWSVSQPGTQQRLSRLILTGFMGAGKSTVGAILARDLGWRFIDLDDVIEASSKRTVAEIFRDLGEANFREQERQAVRQLSTEEKIVLALGGGTVEDESTRSLLLHSPGNCLVFLAGCTARTAGSLHRGREGAAFAGCSRVFRSPSQPAPSALPRGPRYRGNYRLGAAGSGRSGARARCRCEWLIEAGKR